MQDTLEEEALALTPLKAFDRDLHADLPSRRLMSNAAAISVRLIYASAGAKMQ